jgi:AraC family transcriptional regulator, transcriptional activator FtrA
MPSHQHQRQRKARRHNPLVVALVYEGLCSFEYTCAAEVFGLARPEVGADWYRFETASQQRGHVSAQYGLRVKADVGLERMADAGTIVVAGWTGVESAVPSAVVDALVDAHARGARLLSICSGVVVLAATVLLDGKRAATHWRYADLVQRRFPKVSIDPNVLYVDEGQILTSAGSAAGLDLCLHLVRRDYGSKIANQVARRLVIPAHRDGGQSQYVERPVNQKLNEKNSISAVLDTMRSLLSQPLRIAELADLAKMSERTFMRRFKECTGLTCGDWIIRERVDFARELLENSQLSVEEIAEKSGFGSAITMRHHFRAKLATSPVAYRNRFSTPQANRP